MKSIVIVIISDNKYVDEDDGNKGRNELFEHLVIAAEMANKNDEKMVEVVLLILLSSMIEQTSNSLAKHCMIYANKRILELMN